MKKLFIAVPLMGVLFFNSSCKKDEPETITVTETVTVTDTLTVTETLNNSVAITMEPYSQIFIGGGYGYGSVSQNFSATNIGDKKISYLFITFEAKADDGSIYTGTGSLTDIGINETISGQTYISTGDKECKSIKVKEVEITTY